MPITRIYYSRNEKPVLTAEQKQRLEALKNRPIDLPDIPEQLDWSNAVQGRLTKKRLPVNDDVYKWLQKEGKPAEVRLNELLY